MAMPFLESPRFPEDLSYGTRGGPAFSTTIATVKSGVEWRNQNWVYPLSKYEALKDTYTRAETEQLLAHFIAVAGQYYGFRFKDPLDYKSCSITDTPAFIDQVIGVGNGVQVDFQLIKSYTFGPLVRTRKITKPVTGTVVVSINNIEQTSGWSIDNTTGIITFNSAPGVGLEVAAGYEYDVPVRYASDEFVSTWDSFDILNISVPIMEIRL